MRVSSRNVFLGHIFTSKCDVQPNEVEIIKALLSPSLNIDLR